MNAITEFDSALKLARNFLFRGEHAEDEQQRQALLNKVENAFKDVPRPLTEVQTGHYYEVLGKLNHQLEKYKEALAFFEQIPKGYEFIKDNRLNWMYQCGAIYYLFQNYTKALSILNSYRFYVKDAIADDLRGRIYMDLSQENPYNIKLGINAFKSAVCTQPQNSTFWDVLDDACQHSLNFYRESLTDSEIENLTGIVEEVEKYKKSDSRQFFSRRITTLVSDGTQAKMLYQEMIQKGLISGKSPLSDAAFNSKMESLVIASIGPLEGYNVFRNPHHMLTKEMLCGLDPFDTPGQETCFIPGIGLKNALEIDCSEAFGESAKAKIIDVCAGNGKIAALMQEWGYKVVAVDINVPRKAYTQMVHSDAIAYIEKHVHKDDILALIYPPPSIDPHGEVTENAIKAFLSKGGTKIIFVGEALTGPTAINSGGHFCTGTALSQHMLQRLFNIKLLDESACISRKSSDNLAVAFCKYNGVLGNPAQFLD